jgi:hypothetical protein
MRVGNVTRENEVDGRTINADVLESVAWHCWAKDRRAAGGGGGSLLKQKEVF